MQHKIRILFFIGVIALLSCNFEKSSQQSDTSSHNVYVYIPILKVNNKRLMGMLDSVIQDVEKCTSNSKNRYFSIYQGSEFSPNQNSIDTVNDNFIISSFGNINNDSISNDNSDNSVYGCFWFKDNFFDVSCFFRNSGWFSLTNKRKKFILKKQIETEIKQASTNNPDAWFYEVVNTEIYLTNKQVFMFKNKM